MTLPAFERQRSTRADANTRIALNRCAIRPAMVEGRRFPRLHHSPTLSADTRASARPGASMYAVILDDAELNNLLMTQAIRGLPDCEPKAFTRADKGLAFVNENAAAIGIAVTLRHAGDERRRLHPGGAAGRGLRAR